MRKFLKSGLVLVTVLACVAMAGAQRGGGGGRGQRGQRGGGGEMGLVMRPDVQTELAITDDEKTKLTELQAKERAARQNGGGGGGGQGGDPAERAKAMEEQRAQAHKDLAAILTDTQMKRLGELVIQQAGARAVLLPAVQKSLGLSDDQITKIKDLNTKMNEANTALRAKVRSQEMTREEMTAAVTKNNATMTDELGKILTADQTAKLKDLGGKPFTFATGNGGGL